jgi:hypothetical protein
MDKRIFVLLLGLSFSMTRMFAQAEDYRSGFSFGYVSVENHYNSAYPAKGGVLSYRHALNKVVDYINLDVSYSSVNIISGFYRFANIQYDFINNQNQYIVDLTFTRNLFKIKEKIQFNFNAGGSVYRLEHTSPKLVELDFSGVVYEEFQTLEIIRPQLLLGLEVRWDILKHFFIFGDWKYRHGFFQTEEIRSRNFSPRSEGSSLKPASRDFWNSLSLGIGVYF